MGHIPPPTWHTQKSCTCAQVIPTCSDVAWPKHQKMCTAEKPFRAAGTGLGKESLSTKLVPGKIAGSMHSTLAPREVAITASAQAQDLPSMSSLDINKQVACPSIRHLMTLIHSFARLCVCSFIHSFFLSFFLSLFLYHSFIHLISVVGPTMPI